MALAPDRIVLKTVGWTLLTLLFMLCAPMLISASLWILAGVILLGAALAITIAWLAARLRRRRRARYWPMALARFGPTSGSASSLGGADSSAGAGSAAAGVGQFSSS